MVHIILLRGPPAAGKSTTAKLLAKEIKNNFDKNVAKISEDNFRKEMQFKYKAKDLICHEKSFELISTIIQKLLEIDTYNYIIFEGLFRYQKIFDKYIQFFEEKKYTYSIFYLTTTTEILIKRYLERNKENVKELELVNKDIQLIKVEREVKIDTTINSKEIIKIILQKTN